MQSQYILCALFFMCLSASAQTNYKPGYFIDNSGQKVEGLIRDLDWKNNPTDFKFKSDTTSEPTTMDIGTVREFGFPGMLVFKRFNVGLDVRRYLSSDLNQNRKPLFEKKLLFLKLLVKGDINLYSYEMGNLFRFFYGRPDATPSQLIYTRYITTENKIFDNQYYKAQLSQDLICKDIDNAAIDRITLNEKDLTELFVNYNSCAAGEVTVYKRPGKKGQLRLSIRPGLDYASLTVRRVDHFPGETNYDNSISFRIGAELEIALPFNNNKWALHIEPFYKSFQSEGEGGTEADYKAIVVAAGARHYIYLNNDSKLFFNGNVGMEFTSDSYVTYNNTIKSRFEIRSSILDNYWAAGAGYNWRNKLSLELRYNFKQDLLVGYDILQSDLSGVSFIVGYNLL